jgi:Zn-dependent protease with chaperone function
VHPEDQAALEELRAIPLFSECLQAVMKLVPERLLHGLNMAQKVRLGPQQLPGIYQYLPPACEALGIAEPEFYLEMDPRPNAYTFGDKQAFVTVTSGLVEALEPHEVQSVVAHECGHIALQHTLYHTMAALLALAGTQILGPLAALAAPVRLGLLYWVRRSELSADRAAAAVMGGSDAVVNALIRLAGGPKSITGQIDVERYAEQAAAYDKLSESQWDQLLQGLVVMNQSHPFLAVRTREIVAWGQSEQFRRIMAAAGRDGTSGPRVGPVCPACGRTVEATWKFCQACGTRLPAAGSGG